MDIFTDDTADDPAKASRGQLKLKKFAKNSHNTSKDSHFRCLFGIPSNSLLIDFDDQNDQIHKFLFFISADNQ